MVQGRIVRLGEAVSGFIIKLGDVKAMSLAVTFYICALVFLISTSGCKTPDTVQPFPYHESWTERIADPGKVDIECGGRHEDAFCGCTVYASKTVWLSRHIKCFPRREKTRQHEACHVVMGPSKAAVKMCHDIFERLG